MATSLETSLSPDKPLSRKRKQDFSASDMSKTSSLSGWTDYLYSSPSSPSTSMSTAEGPLTHHQTQVETGCDFNFDAIFGQNLDHVTTSFDLSADHMQPSSGATSRRHSVAVGEMDYHSFPAVKQEFRFDTDLQQLLDLPSSWSSSDSSNASSTPENVAPAAHKRTLSLRLETNHTQQQQQQPMSIASPTTPNFFSPGFLDALNADEDKDTVFTFPTDTSFTQSLAFMNQHQEQQQDFVEISPSPSSSSVDPLLHHQGTAEANTQHHHHHQTVVPTNTIAPSAISNNVGGWMTDRRHAKSRLSPPISPSNTMSSSSPSPPVTPMQPLGYDSQHVFNKSQHPAIPEEDEEMSTEQQQQHHHQQGQRQQPQRSGSLQDDHVSAMRAAKGSLVAARMQLGASTAMTLKPHIRNYLLSNDPAGSGERTVMILTSKVAQKSYGTEKRFLCPPPTTVLMGSSWWTSDCSLQDNNSFYSGPLTPPKLTINISGEQTIQNGNIEWYTSTGTLLDGSTSAAAAAANAASSGDTIMTGKCVSKHLHINDADEKRKRVEVRVQMQLGNGVQLGTLASKGIKVISKPSKKRQSVKNMELCIHHGTTISLFNRIRSQTVSTKYLGVSTNGQQGKGANGTCFVARTGSWDPFVIWIVDTSRAPDIASIPRKHHPTNPHYPPPPAIALQTDPSQQPMAIHYNQAVVLQCVTTGLVSPVMVIRKVDKGSMVLGGNKVDDLSCTTGGECGDECLGDPVSQLHKVAFQIVQDPSMAHSNKASYRQGGQDAAAAGFMSGWTLPQSCQPITYLACLNDVVGMHKTTTARSFITQPPDAVSSIDGNWSSDYVVSQEGGKVVRKRRVSCDVVKPNSLPAKLQQSAALGRRRVNSVTDVPTRRGSICSALSDRRGSTDSSSVGDGACWTEDVSDAAIWTIVGTDCATYTFWTPSPFITGETMFNSPFTTNPNIPQDPTTSSPITPFPVITQIAAGGDKLIISGESFSRDLAIWFGDIKAPSTEYKSRESLICSVPDLQELLSSPVTTIDEEDGQKKLPILLVRGDGVVYQTGRFYSF